MREIQKEKYTHRFNCIRATVDVCMYLKQHKVEGAVIFHNIVTSSIIFK